MCSLRSAPTCLVSTRYAFPHALRQKATASTRVMRACANDRGRTTSFQTVSQARPLFRDNANDANTESLHLGRRAMLAALSLAVQATSWHMWPATAEAKTGRMPTAAEIDALELAFAKEVPKAKAPAVLRVVFHDAGPYRMATKDGGVNNSVGFELKRPESFGLARGYRPLEKIQKSLEGTAAAGISMSDLIAYGGAYAVRITGGPKFQVPLGRLDTAKEDPEGRMPSENLGPSELKAQFAAMGFTTQELVAISGAHTIGGKGFGDGFVFDSAYYSTLIEKPWLNGTTKEEKEMSQMIGLPSDKSLPEDEECLRWIKIYAVDQDAFFRDFTKAYLKMIEMGAKYA